MDTETNVWSTASDSIVDPLVGHLKRIRNWRRDGRSLRALNRHWCSSINRHIIAVRPHTCHVLKESDIDSLAKFTNLTLLDAVPFEGTDISHMTERCTRLAHVISELPYLTRLIVQHAMEHIRDVDMSCLKFITELEFKNDGYDEVRTLNAVSGLKIEKLSGAFSLEALNDALPQMPYLKVLSKEYCHSESKAEFKSCISKMKNLRAISMDIQNDWLDTGLMPNLVSMRLHGYPRSFDSLMGLLNLRSLSCIVKKSESILLTPAFLQIMKRLVSLTLEAPYTKHLAHEIFERARVLETLSLENFVLEQKVMDTLSKCSLKHLSLLMCHLPDDSPFPQQFTKLHALTIRHDWNPLSFVGLLSPLQNLTSLDVMIMNDPTLEFQMEIGSLLSLETLVIRSCSHWSDCVTFEGFENLTKLRSLSLYGWNGMKALKGILSMKMLTDLEELTLGGSLYRRDCDEGNACVTALKSRAMHLKVSSSIFKRR